MERATIEKLVFGGQALARLDKKVLFAWNALPGEDVSVYINRKKKSFLDGVAETIHTPSEYRIAPKEEHYLSCSPWQIIQWEKENEWKKLIATETYGMVGKLHSLPQLDITYDTAHQFGYRNKMEFSFTEDARGILQLALHTRGTYNKLVPLTACALASSAINAAAQLILTWLRSEKVPLSILKTVVIRSNEDGAALAGLYVTAEFPFTSFPQLVTPLQGVQVFLSPSNSPASIATKTLYEAGDNNLTETILDTALTYGLQSFFQVNIPLFRKALECIASHLNKSLPLIDMYAGVGAIGLTLRASVPSVTCVESDRSAAHYAQEAVARNAASNCTIVTLPAEQSLHTITHNVQLVLDPPRAGLHEKVIRRIREVLPRRIIYMSCNISTHARDLQLLSDHYEIVDLHLYNFFPRTPHIESLAVLVPKM